MNSPADPALVDRPTLVRYKVLAWACSLSMLTYIDRVCIKQVEPDISRDLGLTEQDFKWVFAAFGLAYALFEVPSGWLGDRFGPRSVLCRIVLWWSLFTALTGLVFPFTIDFGSALSFTGFELALAVNGSLLLLILVRFLFGAGEAGAYPIMARALRNWFPYSTRGRAQGLLWTFGRWGGAMAPGLIAGLAQPFGWRGAFLSFGVIGVLWVIAFACFFRNTPAEHPGVNNAERAIIEEGNRDAAQPPPLSWKAMLSSPTLWFLCGMYFCSNAGWCFFITWDLKYYDKVLGLTGTSMKLASGAPLFFGGIACIVGGMTTDRQVRLWGRRWGRSLQGLVAYGLGAGFFLLALATNDPYIAVPSLCAASFLKDFSMAVNWATCIDIGHRYSGTIAGFMNGVGNLGTFFGPLIVAYLANEGRWELALAFSASTFAIASVCWLFINPRRVIVYSPEDRRQLQGQDVLG
jgi:MFS transporter, ACS family, glucarate transporter